MHSKHIHTLHPLVTTLTWQWKLPISKFFVKKCNNIICQWGISNCQVCYTHLHTGCFTRIFWIASSFFHRKHQTGETAKIQWSGQMRFFENRVTLRNHPKFSSVFPHLPILIAISWRCLSIQIPHANCLVGRRPLCRPGMTLRSEIGRWSVWNTAISIVKIIFQTQYFGGSMWVLPVDSCWKHPGSCCYTTILGAKMVYILHNLVLRKFSLLCPAALLLSCPTAMPIFIHPCWKILRLSPIQSPLFCGCVWKYGILNPKKLSWIIITFPINIYIIIYIHMLNL